MIKEFLDWMWRLDEECEDMLEDIRKEDEEIDQWIKDMRKDVMSEKLNDEMPGFAVAGMSYRDTEEVKLRHEPDSVEFTVEGDFRVGDILNPTAGTSVSTSTDIPATFDSEGFAALSYTNISDVTDYGSALAEEGSSTAYGNALAEEDSSTEVEPADDPLSVQVGGGHYKGVGIQPVEYIQANNLTFLEGNAIKYISRHRRKAGRQDIEKAIHYLQLLIDFEYPDR